MGRFYLPLWHPFRSRQARVLTHVCVCARVRNVSCVQCDISSPHSIENPINLMCCTQNKNIQHEMIFPNANIFGPQKWWKWLFHVNLMVCILLILHLLVSISKWIMNKFSPETFDRPTWFFMSAFCWHCRFSWKKWRRSWKLVARCIHSIIFECRWNHL